MREDAGMDLTEFLAARLGEDEAIARSAADDRAPWQAIITDDRETTHVIDSGEFVIAGWLSDIDARHIARHDPARVLREIEAGRKMLARYQIALALLPGKYKLGYCEAYEEVLKICAGRFADHPDYDKAWHAETAPVPARIRHGGG
jgi:hypothetical protein